MCRQAGSSPQRLLEQSSARLHYRWPDLCSAAFVYSFECRSYRCTSGSLSNGATTLHIKGPNCSLIYSKRVSATNRIAITERNNTNTY